MRSHESIDERESNAGALMSARPRAFYAMEAIKQVWQLRVWNADTGVGDTELGVLAAPGHGDSNASIKRMLEGIGEKVEDNFLPHVAINVDRLRKGRATHGQGEAGLFDCGAKYTCQFRRTGREVGRLVAGLDAVTFDT